MVVLFVVCVKMIVILSSVIKALVFKQDNCCVFDEQVINLGLVLLSLSVYSKSREYFGSVKSGSLKNLAVK